MLHEFVYVVMMCQFFLSYKWPMWLVGIFFIISVNCSSNSCVLCSLKACKPMLCSGQAVAPNEAVKRMKGKLYCWCIAMKQHCTCNENEACWNTSVTRVFWFSLPIILNWPNRNSLCMHFAVQVTLQNWLNLISQVSNWRGHDYWKSTLRSVDYHISCVYASH